MDARQATEGLAEAARNGISLEEFAARIRVYADAQRRQARRLRCGLGLHAVESLEVPGWPDLRFCRNCGTEL